MPPRLFSRKDCIIFLLILAGLVWVFVTLPPLAGGLRTATLEEHRASGAIRVALPCSDRLAT
jgi:hypothetical protein